ncbi:MAG: DNA translocase FtsK, partial [Leptospiraceae bacterium]|nr:DNA translocase FtsK [Leptospiraceae bacterium]
ETSPSAPAEKRPGLFNKTESEHRPWFERHAELPKADIASANPQAVGEQTDNAQTVADVQSGQMDHAANIGSDDLYASEEDSEELATVAAQPANLHPTESPENESDWNADRRPFNGTRAALNARAAQDVYEGLRGLNGARDARDRTRRSDADEGFQGFFTPDESRFHFRGGPRTHRSGNVRQPQRWSRSESRSHVRRTDTDRQFDKRDYDRDLRASQTGGRTAAQLMKPMNLRILDRIHAHQNDREADHDATEAQPGYDSALEFNAQMDTDGFVAHHGNDQDLQNDREQNMATDSSVFIEESEVDFQDPDLLEDNVTMVSESEIDSKAHANLSASDGSRSEQANYPADEQIAPQRHSSGADDSAFDAEDEDDQLKLIQSAVPESMVPEFRLKTNRRYTLPTDILQYAKPLPAQDVSRDIDTTRERLEKVMQDYGVQARVVHIQRGPIITLFEIKLEPGVKVSRILGVYDEIKMHLEAPSIRIIAPIPGKSTIGIEVPNKKREPVLCGEVLRSDSKSNQQRELNIILGKNIQGEILHVDLTRLPHLLIAGATGAGKSVYMNSIIASLLYGRSPEDVRFLMIDPKMVELKLYEGIPHLISPVITDVRLASKALTWTVAEMERRYSILSHSRCRDIRSYNDRFKAGTLPTEAARHARHMPYLVVFIDELSDLMMVAAKDVEDSIIRLTQKARAVGIHIIMATQRPSVDVITALIKANCPARIAFHVAQKTDSRTILDANGAETLLGRGDMLYKSPVSTGLIRIQAPLITEEEIERIVAETRRYGRPAYIDLDASDAGGSGGESEDVDPALFEEAWKIVLESGKTSTSYIQRRLRIGYNRAANIIEEMERRGYLGPAIGNKPREILKRS